VETEWIKIKDKGCNPIKVNLAVSGGAFQSDTGGTSVRVDDSDVKMESGAPLLVILNGAMNF
jgi:hypothetical protein